MPMHDWTRVTSGSFHHFHQGWCREISRTLNRGPLPDGYAALVEQRSGAKEADLLAIEERHPEEPTGDGGVAVRSTPRTKYVSKSDREYHADKASRVVIRHQLGRVVAFIDIVSPGNKHDTNSFHDFRDKIVEAIRSRVHVLVVDLFPPGRRDPRCNHKSIWERFEENDPFELEEPQNRVLASYEADGVITAYVETLAVGEPLPAMPLFIDSGAHVLVPLEETYNQVWIDSPKAVRRLVDSGRS